jgi:hypothetical protein
MLPPGQRAAVCQGPLSYIQSCDSLMTVTQSPADQIDDQLGGSVRCVLPAAGPDRGGGNRTAIRGAGASQPHIASSWVQMLGSVLLSRSRAVPVPVQVPHCSAVWKALT